MIGEMSNAMIAKYLIEEAEQRLTDIDEGEAGDNYDYVTVDIWADAMHMIGRAMRQAKCLLSFERRNSKEIAGIEKRY